MSAIFINTYHCPGPQDDGDEATAARHASRRAARKKADAAGGFKLSKGSIFVALIALVLSAQVLVYLDMFWSWLNKRG